MNAIYEDDVLEFTVFQNTLVKEFMKRHPECKDTRFLLDFPRKGTLKASGKSWNFLRHGAGIRFTMEFPPKLVIDVHERFNEPGILDAWRLTSFLESKGRHVDQSQVLLDLQKMTVAGLLMTSDGYSFSMVVPGKKGEPAG